MPNSLADQATINLLAQRPIRPIFNVKIQLPAVTVRLTTHTKPVSFGGEEYLPAGIGSVGAMGFGDDGGAGTNITLSGVDQTLRSALMRHDSFNSAIDIRLMLCDDQYQSVGNGLLWFSGVINAPVLNHGKTSDISIALRGKHASMNRVRSMRYSHQEQLLKHPGDLGMQYAASVANATVIWPAASFFRK